MPPFSTKTDKPKDTKKAVSRLLKYIWKFRFLAVTAVLLSVFSNIFALVCDQSFRVMR